MRRSDRYKNIGDSKVSRVDKNRHSYDEINSKIGYDTIPTYDVDKRINLSSLNSQNLNRSEYHKIKEYKDLLDHDLGLPQDEVRPKRVSSIKEYDINKVLDEAKKNREIDELEGKRKVDRLNTLDSLNKKYLYQKGFTEEDSQELKDLIDTITTKKLSDDIKDEEERELLSDLLATTIDIKLEKELSKEDFDRLLEEKSGLTSSFYTESLELTEDDLLKENEVEEDEEASKKGFKIVLISIFLFGSFITILYFLLKILNII